MQLIQLLAAGLKNTDGTNLAAGKVLHYAAGTTTLKNLYTDYAGTTPAAQPVVLDSRGIAEVFGSGLYKLVITDAADAVIDTIDNFTASDPGVIVHTTPVITVASAFQQAVFNTPPYEVGTGSLAVYMNGVRLFTGYSETSSTSITLGTELAQIVTTDTEMAFEVFSIEPLAVPPPFPRTIVLATSVGQSVFAVPYYEVGAGTLHVYMNGIRLATGYTESSNLTVTLGATLAGIVVVGTEMMFEVIE